ncbi:MAG TPA: hypothetical protein VEA59_02410 [Patescibacteria group bacterium]|nr:hypothetical protein [Patescibacteria group bacterium]
MNFFHYLKLCGVDFGMFRGRTPTVSRPGLGPGARQKQQRFVHRKQLAARRKQAEQNLANHSRAHNKTAKRLAREAARAAIANTR